MNIWDVLTDPNMDPSYEDIKDLLDNHVAGLELERDGDNDIVMSVASMMTFDSEDLAYAHLKRYMREKGWW